MNKDKHIAEIKREILEADNRNANERDVYYSAMYRGQKEGLEIALEHIQSDPEEKTNFDMITESPQKLYKFILGQYGYSQVKEGECYYNLGRWLNEKAGE